MDLGTFSVSLAVKDIRKSAEFYSWLSSCSISTQPESQVGRETADGRLI